MVPSKTSRLISHVGLKSLYGLCCLAALLISCKSTGKPPDTSVRGSQASFILPATALFQAYDSNLVAADGKYRDRVIYITGAVDIVESDLRGGYSVTLQAGAGWDQVVNCEFSKGQVDYILKLTRGSYVRIKGRCSGKIPTLTLSDCLLVDEKGTPLGG